MVDPQRLDRYYGDRKPYRVTATGVAVIDIVGPLAQDPSFWDEIVEGVTSYESICKQIEDAGADTNVKGIVLAINSPGGEVTGSFETAALVEAVGKRKPTCAVANDGAFSAAYLIASAAQSIYAQPVTGGVGSIGVIMAHADYSGWLKKAGIDVTLLYRGDHKADFSPYAPLNEGAKSEADDELDRIYGEFVGAVSRRRGMTTQAVQDTQARLFFGEQAIAAKLADKVGSLKDAIRDMEAKVATANTPTSNFGMAAVAAMNSNKGVAMATENAAADQVVDIEKARKDAQQTGYDMATEIVELCALAGKPGMAAGFTKANKSVAEVRKALIEARADEDRAQVSNATMPEAGLTREPLAASTKKFCADLGLVQRERYV